MSIRKLIVLYFAICAGLATNAQITPQEAVLQMQKGINMGNTLEPPRPADWNNPYPAEFYFDKYKQAGFDLVRVPVRWDKHTKETTPYTIDPEWLDLVEKVLDWGLSRDLFIIVNAHHDDWIKHNYSNPDYRARFDSIWSQIATRFKDKTEKLIFEILNEPKGLTKEENDEMHQRVLSIIRKTNPTRLVIFQGHEWGGADELVTAAIPDDDFVIGSFHAYSPYTFAMLGQGTWGTSAGIQEMKNIFHKISNWSVENDVPVFFGEFGAVRHADYNSQMKNYFYNVLFAQQFGFAWAAWDNGINGEYEILERDTRNWNEVVQVLIHTTPESPVHPQISLYQDTIIHLGWTNKVEKYDSIHIQRKRSTRNFTTIATIPGDSTNYFDIKPLANFYYYYRVIGWISGKKNNTSPVRIFMPVYTPKTRELYLGSPAAIPGIVEAENYDMGGEGLTYHESSPTNIPGDYRPYEGVDVYERPEGGYQIGNVTEGEWYEYTVDVATSGVYFVTSHIASLYGGGTFQITIGDSESDTLTAPQTWSSVNTSPVSTVMYLNEGTRIMRFTVCSEPEFEFDRIEFSAGNSLNSHIIPDKFISVYRDMNRNLVCEFDAGLKINRFRMYSTTGSLVYSANNPGNRIAIPVSGKHSGWYIIKAFNQQQAFTQKVIIH